MLMRHQVTVILPNGDRNVYIRTKRYWQELPRKDDLIAITNEKSAEVKYIEWSPLGIPTVKCWPITIPGATNVTMSAHGWKPKEAT